MFNDHGGPTENVHASTSFALFSQYGGRRDR